MKPNKIFRAVKYWYLLCCLPVCFMACQKGEGPGLSGFGKQPVYLPASALDDIRSLEAQPIENTGPIFLLDTLFFMTEMKKGIHVFNVKDSSSIKNVVYFNIPAVTDFTINNGLLYADSWTDLLTIDINDLHNIQLLNREKNVFEPLLFPPLYRGIFECVNVSLGAVVGWSDVRLQNVKCQTFL